MAMSDAELRRRRKLASGLALTTSTIGLGALGATSAAGVLRKVGNTQLKAGKIAGKLKVARADKIEHHIPKALTAGAGIGGVAGYNYAAITSAEAKKRRVSKARVPTRAAGFLRRGVTNTTGTEHWLEVGRKDNPWRVTTKTYPNQGDSKTKGHLKKMPVAVTAGIVGGYGTIGGVTAWQAHKKKMQTVQKDYDPERNRQKRLRQYENTSRKVGTGASLGAAAAGGVLAGARPAARAGVSRWARQTNTVTAKRRTMTVDRKQPDGSYKKTRVTWRKGGSFQAPAHSAARVQGAMNKVGKIPTLTGGKAKAVAGLAGLGIAGQVASNRIEHYRRGKGRSYQPRISHRPQ